MPSDTKVGEDRAHGAQRDRNSLRRVCGRLMTALLDDIGTALTTASVVGGATGWALAKAFEPPTPNRVVSVYETGGGEPDQTDGTKYDSPTFQVRVRGDEFGYSDARDKMDDVFAALNDATISGYVYVFARQSGPIPLGHDGNTRPLMTLNFQALRER